MLTSQIDGSLTASIIVPTFNRRPWLERLLRALETEHAGGVSFEVVVTVDGGSDGTAEILEALETTYSLRALTQPNRGPAAARNRAMAVAEGDVLIFLDDDVVPARGLVARHIATHRGDSSTVGIGAVMPPPGRKMTAWAEWEATSLKQHYDALTAGEKAAVARYFFTGDASVRREHALAVGGFDESFRRGEDVELAYRLADHGLRFQFVPGATVLHESDHTLDRWLRIPYQYGCQDVILARDRGRAHVLQLAYDLWPERHPLTRAVAAWCVGRPQRLRAVMETFMRLVRYTGPGAPRRLQMVLCAALFNIQYWQGIADTTGLGAHVWDASTLSQVSEASIGIAR